MTELSKIRTAFNEYFEGQVALPDPIPGKGAIDSLDTGWTVRFVLCHDEQGFPFLDFAADHRMTNPRHHRINHEGIVSFLEMFREHYSFDPNVPGDREKKQAEYFSFNRRVYEILREKGLAD